MRDTVIVDGVRLTRAQVEKAQRELNAPEFKGGDVLVPYMSTSRPDLPCVVVNGNDEWLSASPKEFHANGLVIVTDVDGILYFRAPVQMKRIGSLAEIVKFYREQKGL